MAMFIATAFAQDTGVFDSYFKEATSRCNSGNTGSFLCDAVRAYSTMNVRGVNVASDPYARMILCSNFALATKYERHEVYEGVDVELSYKSNGEIAWVLLTRIKNKCGGIARDMMHEGYLK